MQERAQTIKKGLKLQKMVLPDFAYQKDFPQNTVEPEKAFTRYSYLVSRFGGINWHFSSRQQVVRYNDDLQRTRNARECV